MCGIAGIIDLSDRGVVPTEALERMAGAIFHRGPDEDGFLLRPGVGLASRRLSLVGLADGRQPIFTEDRSAAVVFNGELFDYPEKRQWLQGRGHTFATHCDTELVPHLWEDFGEGMFEHIRGQFAFALWDERQRQVILARDRFGVCPLYWTRQRARGGDWLLFASEVKALLASGLVEAKPDPRGIDQVFNFFAIPGPATCFAGVQLLQPGHYLKVRPGGGGQPARLEGRVYWEMDFPDHGQEERGQDPEKLADAFEEVLLRSVERRLRADVPVVSYLSGGVDSSLVVAMACRIRGGPVPTFTIQILKERLDETGPAGVVSRHVGAEPHIVPCGDGDVCDHYQRLVVAGEGPVVDTSSTGLMLLAGAVHRRGYKAALSGDGSDEWLAGYPWFQVHRLVNRLNAVPGVPLGMAVRKAHALWIGAGRAGWDYFRRLYSASGGHNAFHDLYNLMGASRFRFYSPEMLAGLADHVPYDAMGANLDRVRRWHPLHRGLYWGARILLAGHLLSLKGDRVSMHSSVETRYPFLDEDVFAFLAQLHPDWKLRGLREKYLLRLVAQRWLPKRIAWARKSMFRAPLDSFFLEKAPPYVEQLLSDESLRKTGYFDPARVRHWRQNYRNWPHRLPKRASIELGLVAVVATQLWHHTFIDPTLADLPSWRHFTAGPAPALVKSA